MFASMGIAMPDGSYYIRNADDLQNAIDSVGRATPNAGESDVARRNAVRRHIIKRAGALKLSSKIPKNWGADGSLDLHTTASHVAVGEAFIQHFGRKGMKWGAHIFTSGPNSSTNVHPDVARARAAQATIKTHGLHALGNADLKALNQRHQLEADHVRLTTVHKSEGQKFVENYARQQTIHGLNLLAAKHGPHAAAWLVKQGIKVTVGAGKHAA
jgi:hypothetical protein